MLNKQINGCEEIIKNKRDDGLCYVHKYFIFYFDIFDFLFKNNKNFFSAKIIFFEKKSKK